MVSPISSVNPETFVRAVSVVGGLSPAKPAAVKSGEAGSFAAELAGAISQVESSARASGELRDRLLRGENVELHTVAIQAQHAQTSFELMLQVRNKLIQGYQEIMRMQI